MVGETRRFVDRDDILTRAPTPPDGAGPVLEWFREPRCPARYAVGIPLVLMPVIATVGAAGFEWVSWWGIWAIMAAWALFLYFGPRPMLCAGADWYRCGRRFVKTYELVSVKVSRTSPGDASWHLDLKDAAGRKTTTRLKEFQSNPLLWDLVYNGILHSVRNGARTNRDSREYLSLRPDRP